MAKYYSSTFGKISGKHGSAVAVTRKDGTTYIRMHVIPHNPKTDKQQAHRSKFALTSKSLVPFNPIFKETIGITNGISAARSYVFKNAIVGEHPNLSIDYERIMFSFGEIEKLQNASVARNQSVMKVSWNFKEMYNCHEDDSVSFVIFNKDRSQTLHIKDIAVRSDEEVKIEINDSWVDCDLCLWAYVAKDDKISDSVFVRECDVDLDDSKGEGQAYNGIIDNKLVEHEVGLNPQNRRSDHIVSPIQSLVNGVIVSLIMMKYNLLGLFKQVVTTTNDRSSVAHLAHKSSSVMKCIYITDIERVPKPNLKRLRMILFEVFFNKYNNTYSPVPIYIMR